VDLPPEPAEDPRVGDATIPNEREMRVEEIRRIPGRKHRVVEEGIQSA